jgi:hypothetical protein
MNPRVTVKFMRKAVAAAVFMGVVLIGSVSAVRADDPPAPVQLQETGSYGPAINPTVATDTPVVNPGKEIRVVGTSFCANATVIASIVPPLTGFPKTLTSDAQGTVSLSYTAPAGLGPYTVTLTGKPMAIAAAPDANCGRAGSTVVTVVEAAAAGPVPRENTGSGNLPATGSSTTGLQLRNGIVAVLAGLGMVLVAARRRKVTPATATVAADWPPPTVTK